ncbi:alanine racemase [Fluviicola taffensis]|uniref:Alanine racemase n=1 Tax=Fluviicola taffensis (strain DSM 16823 / NCIMB 13979 / RW262) TaxID=755732 RepID=F2IAK9_FLUTR|nr:alanine racemase [Fluviicola taffensis]AEA43145.1 Alanine racemase [Fluviicola taffensis DSM 16823]
MRLNYSIEACASIFEATIIGSSSESITHIYFDSRKIQQANGALFFALSGHSRSGNEFIENAYQQGIRFFVIAKNASSKFHPDALYFQVEEPLTALQQLATHHRKQYTYPVVAITGSVGKTTFKEWIFHCISDKFKVVRSPKSFNSQIGVALSLLEMHENASIAFIEAGISKPGEMKILRDMIQPDFGIFTAFGKAHRENFADNEEHLLEKWTLFRECKLAFIPHTFADLENRLPGNFQVCESYENHHFPIGYSGMLGVLKTFLAYLQFESHQILERINSLPTLALRMEVFEGVNGNTIINDTYNLDFDALSEALIYQRQLAPTKKRIVVIGLSEKHAHERLEIEKLITSFNPDEFHFIPEGKSIPWENFHNAVVLVKAHRDRAFEHEVARGKALKHRTIVEINLSAIKHNVSFYQSRIPKEVKILAMVKASSYGSGADKVAPFLQQSGIRNFGVAFADEGVELRKAGIGISSSIVVMNPDPEHSDLIIEYRLEPAIYSFEQLDEFITALIHKQISAYPIHLKFDTGMHRLGFAPSDKERILAIINSQPEVKIQGIYSHLADADNPIHSEFTQKQLTSFESIVSYFRTNSSDSFLAHILNSEGSLRYPESCYDMIRLGISMYGYTENNQLKASLQGSVSWYSSISQIKAVPKGDFIGYGISYQAIEDMTIAIIPVGYADGFRRSLSNGKGSVFIHGIKCPVVGRVCMDMIMVDISSVDAKINDSVEIIGQNQPMEVFAKSMETIPYEVMTGLSKRMHRVYVEE